MAYAISPNGLQTANDVLVLPMNGLDTQANLTIYGTYGTAVLALYISQDNVNWQAVSAIKATDSTVLTGNISPGDNTSVTYYVAVQNVKYVRVLLVSISSGTVQCQWNSGPFGQASVTKSNVGLPNPAALSDTTANPTTSPVGSMGMRWDGASWERDRFCNVPYDLNAATVNTGGASIVSNSSGKKIRLIAGQVSLSVAGSVAFCDNAANGTVMYRTPQLGANTGFAFLVNNGQGVLSGAVNGAIVAVSTANGTITGTIAATNE